MEVKRITTPPIPPPPTVKILLTHEEAVALYRNLNRQMLDGSVLSLREKLRNLNLE